MMDKLFFEVGREVCDNILEKVGLLQCLWTNKSRILGWINFNFVCGMYNNKYN